MSISAAQSRAGRALLAWTQGQLADAARASQKTVADFERGATTPHPRTVAALAAALESAGIEFIAENGGGAGVRMRKAGDR